MESVVYRVLASRMTSGEAYSPMEVVESNVGMAVILALVDPEAARDVLQSIESQSEGVGSGGSGIGRNVWHKAWALADPRGVPERVERDLTADSGKPDWDFARSGTRAMVEILATPPSERLKELSRRIGGVWMPGEDL